MCRGAAKPPCNYAGRVLQRKRGRRGSDEDEGGERRIVESCSVIVSLLGRVGTRTRSPREDAPFEDGRPPPTPSLLRYGRVCADGGDDRIRRWEHGWRHGRKMRRSGDDSNGRVGKVEIYGWMQEGLIVRLEPITSLKLQGRRLSPPLLPVPRLPFHRIGESIESVPRVLFFG